MSDFDDWYDGPDGVKQVIGYRSAKLAWEHQQQRIEEHKATIDELRAALRKIAVEGFACDRGDCEDYEDWAERDQDFRRNIARAALKGKT